MAILEAILTNGKVKLMLDPLVLRQFLSLFASIVLDSVST